MTRKEWLEKFLQLVDSGAPTLHYRRFCRVKAQHIPRHLANIGAYRKELAKYVEADRQEEIRQGRIKVLEDARRAKRELDAQRRKEELTRRELPALPPVDESDSD